MPFGKKLSTVIFDVARFTIAGVLLIILLMPRVARVRDAQPLMSCRNNLHQLALAMHNYASTDDRLPPAMVRDKNGKPLCSWRVLLLPYLEEEALYKQFKLDEPWDSPNNIKLLNRMPKILSEPREPSDHADEQTLKALITRNGGEDVVPPKEN